MDRKTLWIGSLSGVAIWIAINVYSFTQIQYLCLDCAVSYGLPFKVAEIGGLAGTMRVMWIGLIADLLICIGAGIFLAGAAKALFGKRQSSVIER